MNINFSELQKNLNTIEIKSTPVSFLQIIDKTYDEVLSSKIVAYFLNENNSNRNIIRQLLNITKQNDKENFIELLNLGEFEGVKTEDAINSQNRLDIVVRYSTFWIVIENKIWAWESKQNQTNDYEHYIDKINTNHLPVKFIYLKPNYNKSHPSNKNFIELFYSDLIEIFKTITPDDIDDKVKYFYLQDFIKHSEEFFMKNDQFNCNEEVVQFYIDNKKKIDYIIENYNSKSLAIRQLIVDSIKDTFPNFIVHDTSSYIQIFKNNWENKGSTGIHFEIVGSNTNFDSLLGNKSAKLRFAVHNEKNTREKYTNIKQQTLYTKEFSFDSNEHTQVSIQNIVSEIQLLINKFENQIDSEIAQIKKKAK